MAYKFIKDTMKPTDNYYSQKATYAMKPEYITIHNSYNDAPAKNEIAYMKRNPLFNYNISFHVAIDDKEVIQGVEFNRNTWACGDGLNGTGNRKSVSIEICYSKSGGQRYRDAEQNAIEYTAKLLVQLGLTPDRVRYHYDWSKKNCPHRVLDEGRGASFKKAIADEYNRITKKPAPKPTAPKRDEFYRVFDKDNKQVGSYADSSNAHRHGKEVKGIVRHYKKDKLYATKDYRVKSYSKPKADIRVVTVDSLNVRSGAGVQYKIVDTVKKGDAFTVVKELSNGWVQLKSGGFVNAKYLKKT